MLNGDYAAQILGSGINAGEMGGQFPLVHHYNRTLSTLALWSGPCHADKLPTRAAPAVEHVFKLTYNHFLYSGQWKSSRMSYQFLLSFPSLAFYISQLESETGMLP